MLPARIPSVVQDGVKGLVSPVYLARSAHSCPFLMRITVGIASRTFHLDSLDTCAMFRACPNTRARPLISRRGIRVLPRSPRLIVVPLAVRSLRSQANSRGRPGLESVSEALPIIRNGKRLPRDPVWVGFGVEHEWTGGGMDSPPRRLQPNRPASNTRFRISFIIIVFLPVSRFAGKWTTAGFLKLVRDPLAVFGLR
jgi:hypothetical protein